MTAPSASGDSNRGKTVAYKDKSKPADVRTSNINAAKGKQIIVHKINLKVNIFLTNHYFSLKLFSVGIFLIVTCIIFVYFINKFSAVCDAIRTSLGPRGMDKMVRSLFSFYKNIILPIFFRFNQEMEK